MIEIIIDPDFADDPKLIEQKIKLEAGFKNWPCVPGRSGVIYLSNDPKKKYYQDCRGINSSKQEMEDKMNSILYPHLAK